VSYDALIKLMMSRAPDALAAWILGKTPSRVEELDPTIPIASAGHLDKLLSVEMPDEDPLMLHVEVQTSGYPRKGVFP